MSITQYNTSSFFALNLIPITPSRDQSHDQAPPLDANLMCMPRSMYSEVKTRATECVGTTTSVQVYGCTSRLSVSYAIESQNQTIIYKLSPVGEVVGTRFCQRLE